MSERRVKHWFASVVGALLLGLLGPAQAQFQAGVHYQLVQPAQPTVTGDKVEVRELFWYGCSHCFSLEPHLEAWLERKPDYVEYVRQPSVLNRSWENHARAYFTAEALGIVDKTHAPLFDAIHKERRRLRSPDDIEEFFVEQGVSSEDFRKTYGSFSVQSKLNQSRQQGRRYGATGVPTIIVAGKYRTGASMAGSGSALMQVIDFLAAKEAKEKGIL